jgi:hypothetical protein
MDLVILPKLTRIDGLDEKPPGTSLYRIKNRAPFL